ncbi:hypothetical protein [Lacticaseibacillus jixiensis]|uniref:hypothetical protein n=1 Tax=Lacticaseibacillus jixiensis TaxID=3231926 RepID=UPI0036F2CCFB
MILSIGLSNRAYTEAQLNKLGLTGADNYVFAMQWYNHPEIQNFLLIGDLVPLADLIVITDEQIVLAPLNASFSKPIVLDRSKISDLSITKEKRKFYSYDGYLLQFTSQWVLVRRSFTLKGMAPFSRNAEKLYQTINHV